ncbi:MAG: hypothetical protein IPL65_03790 [Lewinellaceae bacterium]|nr:hypothetical protein [Lewinellaceae bacterium]
MTAGSPGGTQQIMSYIYFRVWKNGAQSITHNISPVLIVNARSVKPNLFNRLIAVQLR